MVSYSTDAYEEAKIHLGHAGDELYRVNIYAEHQLSFFTIWSWIILNILSVGHDLVRDYINYWAPIVLEENFRFYNYYNRIS